MAPRGALGAVIPTKGVEKIASGAINHSGRGWMCRVSPRSPGSHRGLPGSPCPPRTPSGRVGRALEGCRFWGHKTLVALGTGRSRYPAAPSHSEPGDCSPELAPCVVPRLGGLSGEPPTHGTPPSTHRCPVGRGEPGTPCTVPAGAGSCPRAGACTCVHARVLARVSARVRARCASASRPRARGQDGTQQARPFPSGRTGDDGRCAGCGAVGAAWGGGQDAASGAGQCRGALCAWPCWAELGQGTGLHWGAACHAGGTLHPVLGWTGSPPQAGLGALQWLCCRQGRGPR